MKKKKFAYFLLFITCSLFLSECKKDNLCDCFKSTGGDIRSERNTNPFHYIWLESKIDLVLTQDTIEHVAVVAGGHLIDKIETTVSHDTLFIRNHNICNFVRSYGRHITAYVSVKFLREVLYWGAGDVSCTNSLLGLSGNDTIIGFESFEGSGNVVLNIKAKASNLAIHTGPANIQLTGTVPMIYLYNFGNGVIHTDDVSADKIYLDCDCTGSNYIRSSSVQNSLLNASILGTGNVYCHGIPGTLIQNDSGGGKLILE